MSVLPPKVISYGVRDNQKLNVVQCAKCSLVYLDNHNHISDEHYENSGMHGNQMSSLDDWLNDTSIDDTRRFNQLYSLIKNANVVDVGCGNGGFLSKCIGHAKSIKGIELENRVINYWKDQIQIEKTFSNNDNNFDLFTAFHLLEHIKDPISFLSNIRNKMSDNSILVIEVPNYDDALIKTYKLKSFKKFTFWSQHLYYYSPTTLKNILRTSGFKVKKLIKFRDIRCLIIYTGYAREFLVVIISGIFLTIRKYHAHTKNYCKTYHNATLCLVIL